MSRLAERMKRGDPIKPIVQAILDEAPPPESALAVLLDAISAPRRSQWKRTLLACWALPFVSLPTDQKVLAETRLGAILANRAARNMVALLAAGFCFLYLGFVYIAYISIIDTPLNRVREAAATSLGRLGTADSIPVLAAAMSDMPGRTANLDKSVRIAACRALTALAPRLPDSGYGMVPLSAVQTACRLLTETTVPVVVDALRLLKVIGGGSAVEPVERCARKARLQPVRDEAAATLAVLQERKAREMQSSRLLRPAAQAPDVEQALLRSVIEPQLTESSLLRPSDAAETQRLQQEETA